MAEHEQHCEHCQHRLCAKRVPIFSSLDEEEISKVAALIHRRKYVHGEQIFMDGDQLDSLVILNKGQVKAYRITNDGKEQILYIFSQGDFLGEKNLFRNRKATYNVEALEDTHICAIRKGDFEDLLGKHPGIAVKIMDELCSRLEQLENALENMGSKDVEARVNAVLLEFAKKYGRPSPEGIVLELPLSREGIANYIGLTRETVSRKMNLLQSEGAIKMIGNKKIIIENMRALEKSTY